MRRPAQSGFTLIELIIAITLVGAISAGLLTAMRNGLLTMERTHQRIDETRRAIGIQDLIRRQIGGAMPVRAYCRGAEREDKLSIFRGNSAAMLLVSSESSTEGARGIPRILFYRVQPNPDGTVRLEMFEQLYSGPWSTLPHCDVAPNVLRPPATQAAPVVLYPRLAYCRFIYRDLNFNTLVGREPWNAGWVQQYLPHAVRIEMAAAPGADTRMPIGPITIPLHISRGPGEAYADEP